MKRVLSSTLLFFVAILVFSLIDKGVVLDAFMKPLVSSMLFFVFSYFLQKRKESQLNDGESLPEPVLSRKGSVLGVAYFFVFQLAIAIYKGDGVMRAFVGAIIGTGLFAVILFAIIPFDKEEKKENA